jgi:phosphoglycerate kinase
MPYKTLDKGNFEGKRVLVRAGLDVAIDDKGNITEDSRIKSSIPTINYLLKAKASKIILMSHFGRPDGKVVDKYKMDSVAKRLSEILKKKVLKLDDCIGMSTSISSAKEQVIVLENLRFHSEEEKNDESFARALAAQADVYVNDDFGIPHRTHASVVGVTKFLPSYAGFLLDSEVKKLSAALNPKKPFVLVMGGAKVSDKIGVLENLYPKADFILVGGAMAFTLLLAKGKKIGSSKFEADKIDLAKKFVTSKLVLPVDFVVSSSPDKPGKVSETIPDGEIGLDIGPKSVKLFKEKINIANTVVWNGPMGFFEKKGFENATKEIGMVISRSKGYTLAGGGDTIMAIDKFNLKGFTHVSSGGGAMLAFLEGKKLPAIAALESSK